RAGSTRSTRVWRSAILAPPAPAQERLELPDRGLQLVDAEEARGPDVDRPTRDHARDPEHDLVGESVVVQWAQADRQEEHHGRSAEEERGDRLEVSGG